MYFIYLFIFINKDYLAGKVMVHSVVFGLQLVLKLCSHKENKTCVFVGVSTANPSFLRGVSGCPRVSVMKGSRKVKVWWTGCQVQGHSVACLVRGASFPECFHSSRSRKQVVCFARLVPTCHLGSAWASVVADEWPSERRPCPSAWSCAPASFPGDRRVAGVTMWRLL